MTEQVAYHCPILNPEQNDQMFEFLPNSNTNSGFSNRDSMPKKFDDTLLKSIFPRIVLLVPNSRNPKIKRYLINEWLESI